MEGMRVSLRDEKAAWHAVMSMWFFSLPIIKGLGWYAHFTGNSFHLYEKCRQKYLELSCIWEGWTEGLGQKVFESFWTRMERIGECWGKHGWVKGKTSKGCESYTFGKKFIGMEPEMVKRIGVLWKVRSWGR